MTSRASQLAGEIAAEILASKRRPVARSPATMTAGAINRELDDIDERNSELGQAMIDAGRGHERPSEYHKMKDPLSIEMRRLSDRRVSLTSEISVRYGPGAPRRLPVRGFGPRSKIDE